MMPYFRKLPIIAVMAVSTATVVASPTFAQQLTGAEFVSTHAGKCVSYSGPSAGIQCFGADGKMNYDDRTYGTDTGRWEVRGNDVCENWVKEPGWHCGPVSRSGSNSFTDGSYTWTLN